MEQGTWQRFPEPRRDSYWIQYNEDIGSSIEFINDQWYNISWSNTYNSYYTGEDQLIEEAEIIGLGSLALYLQRQETAEGKKRERQTSLSTQGSSKYPASKRTKEASSSPIQESVQDSSSESTESNESGGQELTVSPELSIGITLTPDKPTFSMSYAATTVARTTTTQGHGGTGPFSTVGAAGSAPNWPASTGGHQIASGGGSGQAGSTGFGQGTGNQSTAGQAGIGTIPRVGSAPAGGNIPGGFPVPWGPAAPVQAAAAAPQQPQAVAAAAQQPQAVAAAPQAAPAAAAPAAPQQGACYTAAGVDFVCIERPLETLRGSIDRLFSCRRQFVEI